LSHARSIHHCELSLLRACHTRRPFPLPCVLGPEPAVPAPCPDDCLPFSPRTRISPRQQPRGLSLEGTLLEIRNCTEIPNQLPSKQIFFSFDKHTKSGNKESPPSQPKMRASCGSPSPLTNQQTKSRVLCLFPQCVVLLFCEVCAWCSKVCGIELSACFFKILYVNVKSYLNIYFKRTLPTNFC
jgi:hypothetical protein